MVATPLGNLADWTMRARDVIGAVDRIYAEDTRVTATLLARFGITARASALHAHNESQRAGEVLQALANGGSVALVTDAGTPAISDPGARIVRAVHGAGHRVVPIPGACAAIAAASAAGLVAERFVFVGFLPQQAKARRALLETFAGLPVALVFYEAPHRVRATIVELTQALGGERMCVIAREMTKVFEEIVRIRLGDAQAWLDADATRVRGEFVLVVDATEENTTPSTITPEIERWISELAPVLAPAAVARVVASVTGAPRDAIYARAMTLKRER
ncbi:MAG TPA: 16S rRNA (cytidine(1402)-2'-O)-methyltransferase [Casimicrobiaceae bacterium]|nr:16S rRNA (cytidine(1402)-2'-O)-methyltransferase [Casimicrobiaceae bacterium]